MQQDIAALRKQRHRSFMMKGVAFAVASGICYGLYTAFLTLGETQGVWGAWFAGEAWNGNAPLSAFAITFTLAALAAGLNDLFSGLWSLVMCAKNGQLGDLRKTIATKPGRVMMLCAAIGGPFATIAYVVALNSATAAGNPGVIVPIAALNCAIGAVLGRILFKQSLGAHKIAGVLVCLAAAAAIGGTSFANMGPEALFGCLFAFLAAFGWGFEGCVAGFGTVLIDYRIGIAIRQLTAGLLELVIAFPVLAAFGGDITSVPTILAGAITDPALVLVQGQLHVRHRPGHGLQRHVRLLGTVLHLDRSGRAEHRRHVGRLSSPVNHAVGWRAHHGRRHLPDCREPRRLPGKTKGAEQ